MNSETLFAFHIADILKDSNYSLTQFHKEEIEAFNEIKIVKDVKGKPVPYVRCLVRNKEIKLTPEEIVRQLLVQGLISAKKSRGNIQRGGDFHYLLHPYGQKK